MRRSTAAVLAAAVAGISAPAFGASLVTENFSNNTNGYWQHPNSTTAPQNYQWVNTDNTGTAVAPPVGTASGAGEMGGVFTRVNRPSLGGLPNFYGFNIGTLSITEQFEASGVIRVTQAGGGSGINIGFFNGIDSFSAEEESFGDPEKADHHSNFMGINFDDGLDAWVNIFDFDGSRDRSDIPQNLTVGQTIPFSMEWTPPPAGTSEKGVFTVSINNGPDHVQNYTGDLEFVDFTHFGVFSGIVAGGQSTAYFDDLTFTSENPLGGEPGWGIDNNGDWNNSSNWVGGIPNSAGAVATFGGAISTGRVVFTNSNVTVGGIIFNNANTYLLAGLGTLTLSGSGGGSASIDVQQGSHKINLPVVVASDTNVNVATGATLRVSDPVTVNAGVDVTQSGGGTVLYESTVNVLGGGTIQFGNSSHMAALTLASNAIATITPGATKALKVDSVNIAGGKLDLKDNKLITSSPLGAESGGVYGGVQGLVQSARNGGAWNGNGITTSLPAAQTGVTTIGVATGAQIRNLAPTQTDLFMGQTINGTSVVAMYTYAGDANLDGQITGDDYTNIDFNIAVPGADGYYNGDFNYDGIISGDDYSVIDFNIAAQGAPFPTSGALVEGVNAVPEPAGLAGLALAAAGAFGRRRRRVN